MAVVVLRHVIFGDVGKVGQIVGILTGTVDVADLVPAHRLLRRRFQKLHAAQRNGQNHVNAGAATVGCHCPCPCLCIVVVLLPLQLLYRALGRLGPFQVLD